MTFSNSLLRSLHSKVSAMTFEIELDLSRHCIETEIKRVYNYAISTYFKTEKCRKPIEETISLTRRAFELLDFPRLRTEYPPLAGGTDLRVLLSEDDGVLTVFLNGMPATSTRQQENNHSR